MGNGQTGDEIGKKLLSLWSTPRKILRIANNIIINQ